MLSTGSPRPSAPRPPRRLVALLYRQAGLIAACAALGGVAASVVQARQARAIGLAAPWADPPTASASAAVPAQHRPFHDRLARARQELLLADERVVELLVPSGRAASEAATSSVPPSRDVRLALERDPGGSVRGAPSASGAAPATGAQRTRGVTLRLEPADPDPDALGARLRDPWSPGWLRHATPAAPPVRPETPLLSQLVRLEQARQGALARFEQVLRSPAKADVVTGLEPTAAGVGATAEASGATRYRPVSPIPLPGPLAGAVLGLVLAGVREWRGDRMRSPREAEWALDAPVLGAIPTLSARTRNALCGPRVDTLWFGSSEVS